MKIFIIGEREIVLGFKLVGVEGVAAEGREEVLEAFKSVTSDGNSNAKILILTEKAAQQIEKEQSAWQKTGNYPLIVEVPGLNGHLEGRKSLYDAIKEAVGVEV